MDGSQLVLETADNLGWAPPIPDSAAANSVCWHSSSETCASGEFPIAGRALKRFTT